MMGLTIKNHCSVMIIDDLPFIRRVIIKIQLSLFFKFQHTVFPALISLKTLISNPF